MMGDLTAQEVEEVLESEVLGRVAYISDGRPCLIPVTYVYDSEFGDVYVHSAEGTKVRAMRANPEVCFEVEQIRDMANWRTVIARARFEDLWPDREERAMDLLAAKFAPLRVNEKSPPPRLEDAHRIHGVTRSVLYRLHLIEKAAATSARDVRDGLRSARVAPMRPPCSWWPAACAISTSMPQTRSRSAASDRVCGGEGRRRRNPPQACSTIAGCGARPRIRLAMRAPSASASSFAQTIAGSTR
jgi:uncharacterized protein